MQGYINRLLWSSEGGGILPGSGILTAAQKAASSTTGSGPLDVGEYAGLFAVVVLTSFTGGTTPSFQPEWDGLYDSAALDPLSIWKPTAATAATKWLMKAGAGLPASPAAIAGWTLTNFNDSFLPFGRFVWTVVGAPTAVNWQAYVYGKRNHY